MCAGAWRGDALAVPSAADALTSLSIEDLLNVEVTLTSRAGQRVSEAAAAVTVITQEDIQRSGAESVPEALRMVPGLHVAQIDASKWAISARGFNSRFANKLLVLLDGRSVYTPLFAGVDWSALDLMLEDIDRIEVVRGPGGALWGANAVNGVINIVTRSAKETQGGLLSSLGGPEEGGIAGLRYGGRAGSGGHYRVVARYRDRDESALGSEDAADAWDSMHAALRADWSLAGGDSLMVRVHAFGEDAGQSTALPTLSAPFVSVFDEETRLEGADAQAHWRRRLASGSSLEVRASFARTEREISILNEIRDTLDLDFQHRLALGGRRDLVWGLGYRYTRDRIDNSFTVSFTPDERGSPLSSAFVEYLNRSASGRWQVSMGTKVEHNDFTGLEFQPGVRSLWKIAERHSVWAAVSRAVRMPTRADSDLIFNAQASDVGGGTIALVRFLGNPDVRSEDLLAVEAGYRVQPSGSLSLDVTAFYNFYDDLVASETGAAFPDPDPGAPDLIIPVTAMNRQEGESHGAEVSFNWRPLRRWSLAGGYTWFVLNLEPEAGSTAGTGAEGDTPRHQAQLRSMLDLSGRLGLDAAAYFVDRLPSQGVPSYVRLDARFTWRARPGLDLSLGGRNLLERRHSEFTRTDAFEVPVEVERSFYAQARWRF